jgi:SAM-dependent methyltransferase
MFKTKGTNYQVEYKNPWGDRLEFLKKYLPSDKSVVDFGCGNKEVLDYFSPSNYFGIDKYSSHADLVADLDNELSLTNHFDVGLVLGVLEYLDNPEFTIKNIKKFADKFYILVSVAPKKDQWKQSFTKESIEEMLKKYFNNVEIQEYHRYVLCIVEDGKSNGN